MSRFSSFLVAGFVLGLALAACGGGTPSCSAANCGGCCDSDGKCQPGNEPLACGTNAGSCGRCGAGTECKNGTCTATGTGGGSGGGGGATCSPANCSGCCDVSGFCQQGITAGACGVNGTLCATCGGGQVCQFGSCVTGSGGGAGGGTGGGTGGGAGGGTGGGTGGGSGCRQVTNFVTGNVLIAAYWPFMNSPGHYNVVRFVQGGTSGLDGLGLELVYPNDVVDPVPPYTFNITSAGYFQCKVCSVFYESCDTNMQCAKTYLARSGTVRIDRADKAEAGRIVSGTPAASTLHFVEWNFTADTPIANGSCLDVTTVNAFNVGFDGGVAVP